MQFNLECIDACITDDDYTMDFGVHRGTALRILAVSWDGRHYLKYLLNTKPNPITRFPQDETLLVRVRNVLAKYPEIEPTLAEASASILRFGKYRGSSIATVCMAPGGCNYLFQYLIKWENLLPQLKEALEVVKVEYDVQQGA